MSAFSCTPAGQQASPRGCSTLLGATWWVLLSRPSMSLTHSQRMFTGAQQTVDGLQATAMSLTVCCLHTCMCTGLEGIKWTSFTCASPAGSFIVLSKHHSWWSVRLAPMHGYEHTQHCIGIRLTCSWDGSDRWQAPFLTVLGWGTDFLIAALSHVWFLSWLWHELNQRFASHRKLRPGYAALRKNSITRNL